MSPEIFDPESKVGTLNLESFALKALFSSNPDIFPPWMF